MPNSERLVSIMDISFVNSTRENFIAEKIVPKLDEKQKCFIVTANPEIVMETRRNHHYKEIVQSATYVVPDGIGILLAARLKKKPLLDRIAGYDLMIQMLQLANERGASCFFLGASKEVNEQVVQKVEQNYPNIRIAGNYHGYFDIGDSSVLERVKMNEPDFVFVALGYPKQEEWIYRHLHVFSKGIFIGLGGSFDVLTGNVKRAPNIWIKLHLEWLYRLLKQPSRWKRMLPIISFLWLSVRGKS